MFSCPHFSHLQIPGNSCAKTLEFLLQIFGMIYCKLTGWIPYTTYVLYVDGIPVGYGRVRHSSSEYLETVVGAGNLGYGIAKEYRGKGYGSILFKELLKKCKEIGYKEIKLFPMKTNEPTIKIMLKNGGQIIGDFKNQKHIIRIPLE